MKIVQVVHSFPPYNMAGAEVYTYNLSRELAGKHKVSVFYRINNLRLKEYEFTHNNFDGLNIYTVNNTFRDCNSFKMTYKNEIIADKFGRLLDKVKPDIVHIQHLLFLSTSLIKEAKMRDIPVVFTLHDYWLICQQGQFLRRNVAICDNHNDSDCVDCLFYLLSIKKGIMGIYRVLCQIAPNILIRLLKKIYFRYARASFLSQDRAISQIKVRAGHIKQMCEMVDAFIAPSQFLKRKFVEFGISNNKIIFSHYGLNTDFFRDFERKRSKKIRFGFIGTLLPAKGVHLLITAFNKVQGSNAELNIYGKNFPYKGFEHYPGYIKRLAKNENIRFMGEFDHRNVAEIFSEIDILVVPSIWYENAPLVIYEAFMAKVPVITSNIGGMAELVRHGQNGLLFEVNNVADLYEKIKLIVSNTNLIEELRRNIRPPKSIEKNAEEIEELYKFIIK